MRFEHLTYLVNKLFLSNLSLNFLPVVSSGSDSPGTAKPVGAHHGQVPRVTHPVLSLRCHQPVMGPTRDQRHPCVAMHDRAPSSCFHGLPTRPRLHLHIQTCLSACACAWETCWRMWLVRNIFLIIIPPPCCFIPTVSRLAWRTAPSTHSLPFSLHPRVCRGTPVRSVASAVLTLSYYRNQKVLHLLWGETGLTHVRQCHKTRYIYIHIIFSGISFVTIVLFLFHIFSILNFLLRTVQKRHLNLYLSISLSLTHTLSDIKE